MALVSLLLLALGTQGYLLHDASNLNLTSIPRDIPAKATNLILDDNLITEIQNGAFFGADLLEDLSLSGNAITTVGIDSYCLSGTVVTRLNLQDNELTGVPHLKHHSLITLDLGLNRILYVENGSFEGLPSLRYVYLNHNQIDEVHPLAFCGAQLVMISLTYNTLSAVPQFLCLSDTAQFIYLNRNNISIIQNTDFRDLRVLKHLDLGHNRLSVVSGLDVNLGASLEILLLDGNELEILDLQWSHFSKSLERINLGQNKFECIAIMDVDKDTPNIDYVDLRDNPFHCNCCMLWLHSLTNVLTSKVTLLLSPAPCASPPALVGVPWENIMSSDLLCQSEPTFDGTTAAETTSPTTTHTTATPRQKITVQGSQGSSTRVEASESSSSSSSSLISSASAITTTTVTTEATSGLQASDGASTATSVGRTTVPRQPDVSSTDGNIVVVPAATTELPGQMATTQSTDSADHWVSSTMEASLNPNSTNPSESIASTRSPIANPSVLYPNLSQPLAWEEWTYWSQCSATCGQGSRLRWKLCQNNSNGTATCDVEMGRGISYSVHRDDCVARLCPAVWLPWHEWEACSTTCDRGIQKRHRVCSTSPFTDDICDGKKMEIKACIGEVCPEPDDALREKREEYHPNIVFTEADERPTARGVAMVAIVMVALELGILLILDGVRILQALERWKLIRRGR